MKDLGKNLLKLTIGLLKHQAKNIFGEEALEVAAETLVEIGGGKAQAGLESVLSTQEGSAKLLEAAKQADECFRKRCDDPYLRGAMTIPMGELPSVQQVLAELPTSVDEAALLETLKNNLERDFPYLSIEQVESGINLYVDCMHHALLPLEKFTLQIIGQAVLRNELMLQEIGLDVQEIKAILIKISRTDRIDISVKVEVPPGALPLGSYLPFPRNTLFTGREKDLEQLTDSLLNHQPSTTLISQAISGMGGIGKTQLAVEFAYRYGHHFDGVHWLNLANPEALDSEIANCGRAIGLVPQQVKDVG